MEQQTNTAPKQDPQKKDGKNALLRGLLVVGIVILLLVGILLPIKLVPNAVSQLAATLRSVFTPKESVVLKADKESVVSGEQVAVSWTGDERTNGVYSLSYTCTEGLRFERVHPDGSLEPIRCENEFYFTPEDNTVALTAFSGVNRVATTGVTVSFNPEGGDRERLGDLSLVITNEEGASGNETTATTTPSTPTNVVVTPEVVIPATPATPTTVAAPVGKPDLSVRLIAVGYVDTATNTFIPSSSVIAGQQAGIRFEVVNSGGSATGAWKFNATLPSNAPNSQFFQSATQPSLSAGDRIEFTLSFEDIKAQYTNTISIQADPAHAVTESNESNNTLTAVINNASSSNVAGKADLSVKILEVGVINPTNNQFTPRASIQAGERAAVRFEVRNRGDISTGSWKWQASLPSGTTTFYRSENEAPIAPGARTTLTVGFDTATNNGNSIYINLDPENLISEGNEANNTASTVVTIY